MNKLKLPHKMWLERFGEGHEEYLFKCPGCKYDHRVIVKWGSTAGKTEPKWSFNGSFVAPTFNPSLLIREFDGDVAVRVCHSFIKDGRIQFLDDCTHSLKGQTVELEQVEG
jgi:hypothetical protein